MTTNDERNSSELFRFVTVRNPQMLNSTQSLTGFLFPQNSNTSTPKNSNLYAELEKAKEQQLLLEDVQPVVGQFKSSDDYINSKKQIEHRFANWLSVYSWLNDCKNHITLEEINTGLDKVFKGKVSDEIAKAKDTGLISLMWDNLYIQLLEPDAPVIREWIMHILRVANLLLLIDGKADELDNQENIQRLIKARPIISKAISPLPKSELTLPEITSEVGEEDTRVNELLVELEAYAKAVGEIKQVLSQKKEDALIQQRLNPVVSNPNSEGNTSVESAPPVIIGYFDSDVITKLSRETQDVLEDARISTEGFRGDYIVELLNKLLRNKYSELAQYASSGRKMTVIGNTAYTLEKEVYTPVTRGNSGDNPCKVEPLGIADLRIVKQDLLCYKPGEVAHIENVLMGETKERTTRNLTRTESTYTFESEQINETEKDVQTTERYELEKESSNIIQSDTYFDIGVSATGRFGPVQVSTTTGFATNNSQMESNFVASQYAREITSRARNRIIQRVREARTITTIREFEETNLHKLENKGETNMVGMYRWLDKTYLARIENYGKRLMFEFIVPEPSAFHLYAMSEGQVANAGQLEKPHHPKDDGIELTTSSIEYLNSADDINETNYLLWTAAYDVQSVAPPPTQIKTLGHVISQNPASENSSSDDLDQFVIVKENITLKPEEGYVADKAIVRVDWQPSDSGGISIMIGNQGAWFAPYNVVGNNPRELQLENETGEIPVTCFTYDTRYMIANIEIICKPSPEKILAWKIGVYNQIIEAYQNKLGAYNDGLARLRVSAGISIQGNNPLRNREIERDELKRRCIEIYSNQTFYGSWSMQHNEPPYSYPELHVCSTVNETAPKVKFFEQVFEWDLMTYDFYPYYWARKERWTELYPLEDNDTVFSAFLRAGSARVLIPVRPNFEEAALYYLENGVFPPAGELPVTEDETNMSILIDLETDTPVVEDGKWQIKVPTNLVALQCESGCIPEKGLPCYEDTLLEEEQEHDCGDGPVIGRG